MTDFMDTIALEAAIEHLDLEQEQRDAIARLDDADLEQIDRAILSALGNTWQKAGFIASGVMIAAPDDTRNCPRCSTPCASVRWCRPRASKARAIRRC